jgi:hypothetical protein
VRLAYSGLLLKASRAWEMPVISSELYPMSGVRTMVINIRFRHVLGARLDLVNLAYMPVDVLLSIHLPIDRLMELIRNNQPIARRPLKSENFPIEARMIVAEVTSIPGIDIAIFRSSFLPAISV